MQKACRWRRRESRKLLTTLGMGPNEKELLGPESWKRGKHVSWKWCLRTEEHYGACQVRGREEQVRGARVAEDDDCNDTASEGV